MKYAFIKAHRDEFDIALMCEVLEASRSGFYDWLTRDSIEKQNKIDELKAAMRAIFKKSRSTYGSSRMLKALLQQGYRIGKERVAELMRELGLKAKAARRVKAATTNSKHKYPVQENKLKQDFTALKPNTKWVGDVTFIGTDEGWLYLACFLDLCTRKIAGWAMYDTNDRYLNKSALLMALKHQKIPLSFCSILIEAATMHATPFKTY